MELEKQQKPFKTVKAASPETLFARYLQKQGKTPTQKQISTWEYDGGQGCDDADDFVFIHGFLCRNFLERMRARLIYWSRVAKLHLSGDLKTISTPYRK